MLSHHPRVCSGFRSLGVLFLCSDDIGLVFASCLCCLFVCACLMACSLDVIIGVILVLVDVVVAVVTIALVGGINVDMCCLGVIVVLGVVVLVRVLVLVLLK